MHERVLEHLRVVPRRDRNDPGHLPVGTRCTVTETTPSADDLIDGSYAWGATPGPQTVTITQSGQTVPVAVTNTIDRVYGTLTIAKALTDPAGVVDPARTFDIGYSCRYGNDDPVTGSLPLAPGASDTRTRLPIGSVCTVTEDPATLIDPPDRTQPSYVWLPESYDPGQIVTVTTDAPEPKVTVTNTVDHLTGSFGVSKAVDGTGKADGYVAGTPFEFDWTCSWPGDGDSGSFSSPTASPGRARPR